MKHTKDNKTDDTTQNTTKLICNTNNTYSTNQNKTDNTAPNNMGFNTHNPPIAPLHPRYYNHYFFPTTNSF